MAGIHEQVVEHVRPEGGVVVGDDGSASSQQAVRAALEEARRRGTTLHVLRAWTITSAARPEDAPFGYVPSLVEFQAATRAHEERCVAELLGDPSDVPVQVHVVHGPAAQALLEASQTADVVVVGRRGRGGFATLVLGSVADQVVRHSRAPVLVVR